MEEVYKKIVDTFRAHPEVFTQRGLPAIRQIDINIGQPDDPENFEVLCPALFIGWDIRAGSGSESDTLSLDFHLLQEPGAGTENFSERLNEGLEYIRLAAAVKYCLNMLSTDISSPLKYSGERQATTPFFRYHVLTYTCSIDGTTESVHRPTLTESTVESIRLTGGRLREAFPNKIPIPDIETFKQK
ncbi:hypothetical protein [Williamwhitmania taraxaci]|uniref:Gp37 protein n=1 Tax=Williamwhitmania taraxaci TaxID=1640674 RepID=A0A1G6MDW6_9BACT|nr:hypothetical protein [Williamwhitmania taraxaci]SDC53176.1 hypothetical protein SAMN05216323_103536 [Williamwhitmania taraxaci]